MPVPNYFVTENTYNSDYFPAIFEAAQAIASPYLVQQKNMVLDTVQSINGNVVEAGGVTFVVHTDYINPEQGYYAPTPPQFRAVWPTLNYPNALYGGNDFTATIDCVGFGTRVLTATGDQPDDPATNAYCLLRQSIDTNAAHFAAAGFVPSAFEYAIALPVLLKGSRWSYISGSVNAALIQQQGNQATKNYTGISRGGFSTAQAGDIVCFGYEDALSNGHFMVLTAAPEAVGLGQFSNLPTTVTQAYMISVYDSTDKGFSLHFNDSRLNDNDSGCGVGFGQLYIFTNQQDEPVGFIFGPAGTGMEMAHFINDAASRLEIAAISVGRFR